MRSCSLVALAALCLCALAPPASSLTLAAGGHTDYQIVTMDGANARHQLAAAELARFLGEITGATFPVVTGRAWGKGPAIFVGLSPAAMQVDRAASRRGLGPDGLVIKTVGPHLLLYGGEPRGTLYAVYTFLEQLGCRWWTATESTIPKQDSIVLSSLDDRQAPVLEYREPYFPSAGNGDWAVRNKVNGASSGLSEAQGGKITYQGFVHTAYALAPPDQFFKTHPEWYALREGERNADSQLCLTDDGLKRHVTEQVLAWLRANPTANIVSVSQNDNGEYCECPQCTALDAREGSHAGTMLHFVNYVARAVAKEFPNVAIDTLAYQYTRKPPRYVRPDPNVIVRLCTIECNFAEPLTGPSNKAFHDDLVGWNKICNRLYVWDYVTNFRHYLRPEPNVYVLGPNVRTFARYGVKGIFEQGSNPSPGGDMAPLKAWLLAKLLWNPRADADALITEFLNGYYGAAGPYLERHLKLLQADATRQKYYYGCFDVVETTFPTYDTMVAAEDLFRQAARAVAGDADLKKRLRLAHVPLAYTWLNRMDLQLLAQARHYLWAPGDDPVAAAKEMDRACRESGVTMMTERSRYDIGRFLADRRNTPRPAGFEQVTGLLDFQDNGFKTYSLNTLSILDPTASDGTAVATPGSEGEASEVQGNIGLVPQRGRYRAFAVVKCELLPGATGPAFTMAFFNRGQGDDVLVRRPDVSEVKSGEWHIWEYGTIDLGKLRNGGHVWVAPAENPGVKSVAVDRYFLVPAR